MKIVLPSPPIIISLPLLRLYLYTQWLFVSVITKWEPFECKKFGLLNSNLLLKFNPVELLWLELRLCLKLPFSSNTWICLLPI